MTAHEFGLTEAMLERGRAVLEERARSSREITYQELSQEIPGLGVRGAKMSRFLATLSRRSHAERGVLVTVLVISKRSRLPAHGFFELLTELRPDVDGSDDSDWALLARRERNRVFAAYARQ